MKFSSSTRQSTSSGTSHLISQQTLLALSILAQTTSSFSIITSKLPPTVLDPRSRLLSVRFLSTSSTHDPRTSPTNPQRSNPFATAPGHLPHHQTYFDAPCSAPTLTQQPSLRSKPFAPHPSRQTAAAPGTATASAGKLDVMTRTYRGSTCGGISTP